MTYVATARLRGRNQWYRIRRHLRPRRSHLAAAGLAVAALAAAVAGIWLLAVICTTLLLALLLCPEDARVPDISGEIFACSQARITDVTQAADLLVVTYECLSTAVLLDAGVTSTTPSCAQQLAFSMATGTLPGSKGNLSDVVCLVDSWRHDQTVLSLCVDSVPVPTHAGPPYIQARLSDGTKTIEVTRHLSFA